MTMTMTTVREDRTDFSVEIEDVPTGPYSLRVGDQVVGVIQVKMLEDRQGFTGL